MRLRITLEDQSYDVAVQFLPETSPTLEQDPMLASIPESVFRPPHLSETRAEDRVCRSPIAGLVMAVEAQPRQWVSRNDAVMAIEAMKMQNTIYAPMEGVIEEVYVAPGEIVKSGQPLFRVS
jgi:methylmalonyl-CoA carboxyltransferase 1.3S subunit